jgi:hypothetical protein
LTNQKHHSSRKKKKHDGCAFRQHSQNDFLVAPTAHPPLHVEEANSNRVQEWTLLTAPWRAFLDLAVRSKSWCGVIVWTSGVYCNSFSGLCTFCTVFYIKKISFSHHM